MSLIRDTCLRFQMLVHEIGKFGIVGIVGALVQFGLQNALYGRTGLTASVVIATCIATSVTFLGNRYWAFEHRKTANVGRETVLFFFFNLAGMLVQAVFVDADHYWLHGTGRLSYNLATVIGVVFATLFRLFCYRRFVFNLVPPAPVEETPLPFRAPRPWTTVPSEASNELSGSFCAQCRFIGAAFDRDRVGDRRASTRSAVTLAASNVRDLPRCGTM